MACCLTDENGDNVNDENGSCINPEPDTLRVRLVVSQAIGASVLYIERLSGGITAEDVQIELTNSNSWHPKRTNWQYLDGTVTAPDPTAVPCSACVQPQEAEA